MQYAKFGDTGKMISSDDVEFMCFGFTFCHRRIDQTWRHKVCVEWRHAHIPQAVWEGAPYCSLLGKKFYNMHFCEFRLIYCILIMQIHLCKGEDTSSHECLQWFNPKSAHFNGTWTRANTVLNSYTHDVLKLFMFVPFRWCFQKPTFSLSRS